MKPPRERRTRLREFLADLDGSLQEFQRLPERDRGFSRFLRSPALHLHTAVIWAHRHQRKPPSEWIPENELFIDLVRQVLREWGMDSRAAKLVSPTEFRRAVRQLTTSPAFGRFEKRQDAPADESWVEDLEELWGLLGASARIMESDSLLVGSSKLLHHLLPDAFPPVDRTYTWSFLSELDPSDDESKAFWVPSTQSHEREFRVFRNAVLLTGYVGRKQPQVSARISTKPMCGSVPKLVDNAIIAWQSTPWP